jgi:flagellin-like hook-associated protein FlgL
VRLADEAGLADLRITRSDGSAFDVDLSGAVTIQDVITRINAASGGNVTAAFATTGNGLILTDTAGGAGQVTVENLNFAHAREDLGLVDPAAGNIITGRDVHPVRAQGLFHNIARLRDALLSGDQRGITEASEGLEQDYQRIVNLRGQTGARVQELEARTERLEEQNLATRGMLSLLEDADYTDAITRFQTLQMSLQATLQTNGRVLNLSLLDFLG